MTDPTVVSARAQESAADHFRRAGEMSARIDSHHERLGALEERQRAYDARNQQIQQHIASLAKICEHNTIAIGKVEDARERDNSEFRKQLIDALRQAPRAGRVGSTLGIVLAMLAIVVVLVVVISAQLQ